MKIDIELENNPSGNTSDPDNPKAGASVDADSGFEHDLNEGREDLGKTTTSTELS